MKKTLGIIGAEQQEIDLLLEHLSLEKTVKRPDCLSFAVPSMSILLLS